MTYGWAVLIVLVVISTLYYLGVFDSSSSSPKSCGFPAGFSCNEFDFDANGNLWLDFGQATGKMITVTGIGCGANGTPSITSYVAVVIRSGSHAWINAYTNGTHCSDTSDPAFRGKVVIQYTVAGSSLARSVIGEVSAPLGTIPQGGSGSGDALANRWILVPGNPTLGTTDFWVMKYEAKNNGSGTAVSTAAGNPWVSINQINARANCTAIGAHLLTIAEAQTINLNVAAQPSNWMGGVVGTSCMYGGHMQCSSGSCYTALNASADDSQGWWNGTADAHNASIQNCYFQRNNLWGNETRRTMYLSNGQVLWDWSGDTWQWMNDTCIPDTQGGPWYYSVAEWDSSQLDDYERAALGPSNSAWDSDSGVGVYLGCNATGNGVLRGGSWIDFFQAGAFALSLRAAPTISGTNLGFRCAR